MDKGDRLSRFVPRDKYEFTARGSTIRYDDGQVLEFLWGDLYSSMVLWFPVLPKRTEIWVKGVLISTLMNLATLGRYHGSWGVRGVVPFRHLDVRRSDLLARRFPYVRVPKLSVQRLIAAVMDVFSGPGLVTLDDSTVWEHARGLARWRKSHFSRTHALMLSMPALAGVALPTSHEPAGRQEVQVFSCRKLRVTVTEMGVQIETPGQDPVNLNWQYLDSGVWIRGARRPEDVATKLRLQKLQLPPGDFVDFPAWYTVFVYFRSVDMPGWCALKVGRLGIGDSLKLKKFATWLTAYSAERVAEK